MAAEDRSDDDRDRARKSARALDEVAAARALRRIADASKPPWLHEEVARRLGERLGPMRIEPSRILDWWPAIGAGAAVLHAAYPRAQRVAVEPSAARVHASGPTAKTQSWWSLARRGRAPAFDDAASDVELGRAQLVWANMVLHFVADPPALFARWHSLLDVEGLVVFSCPGPGALRELRLLYADCGWPAPTPGFIDMHDLGDMMVHAGFADPVLDQETLSLRWKSADALLAELHQLGGNTAPGRVAGLRTPAWRRRLLAALSERADADGGILMSIEVAYGHGFKAAPRQRAGDPVSVPLETMRAMVRQRRT
ncbi:MAG: methyltransferase domain-containing protein [Caldimonas sp.]